MGNEILKAKIKGNVKLDTKVAKRKVYKDLKGSKSLVKKAVKVV